MKKVIALVVIVILLFAGWYFISHQSSHEKATRHNTPLVYIKAVKVKTQAVPVEVATIGSLQAWQEVDIAPQIGEVVQRIEFNAGQEVQKGQILFQLDDALYEAAVNSATASYNAAKAKYQRYVTLRKTNSVAEQDYDMVTANYQTRLAALNQARVNLAKLTLKAPFSGKISAKKVDAGQYVTQGEALARLVDSKTLKLVYALPQQYLHQLKKGQHVIVSTNAVPGKTFEGTLYYIAPSVDAKTRTVVLHAKLSNQDDKLSPGLFAGVKQILAINNNAMVIPEQAILPSISGPTVYVIKNNIAKLTSITTSVRLNNLVEVTKGLTPGELVASSGLLKLKDGAKVNAKVVTQ